MISMISFNVQCSTFNNVVTFPAGAAGVVRVGRRDLPTILHTPLYCRGVRSGRISS
jgi:hypothetical protein